MRKLARFAVVVAGYLKIALFTAVVFWAVSWLFASIVTSLSSSGVSLLNALKGLVILSLLVGIAVAVSLAVYAILAVWDGVKLYADGGEFKIHWPWK